MRRKRDAKIIGTLGPASNDRETILKLFDAGIDVFRLNFSHGTHADHARTHAIIRDVEKQRGRPIGIMADLQGPKLRVGKFANGKEMLVVGQQFTLDQDPTPGDATRAPLMHPEIFAALTVGANLLVNDGKICLKVLEFTADSALTEVTVGGEISGNKGVNVPDLVLPISPLTEKDRADLTYALSLGVDWIAMSFVQRPEDMVELRSLVGNKAAIMAKLEKPSAIEFLSEIVQLSDGVMVARGDLGVEMPQETVPVVQKKILRRARQEGKPVVVATQMLESMITSPVPTRAETSDVATAVYDGADAVMLSAETAAGSFPVEAATAMNRIIIEVERDPYYRKSIDASMPTPGDTVADAISSSLHHIATVMPLAATFTYTESGFSSFRAARERPEAPVIGCTPNVETARRLTMVWGVHPVIHQVMNSIDDMVSHAINITLEEGFGEMGEIIAITAGMPFGRTGTTNMLRLTRLKELPDFVDPKDVV
ncbi:pyruvate kinase [Granulosicoccus antarcticus]|uniref:Pyruvate kinase n=1 Tax=Granulosicoccus antarcticus IMCC3135 TaxID=1192854 RepID=A0A2Z2NVY8_9GAMM|nr:pyruvate kinase [Granulosicoccus antarcticus]ASJ72960.1 Pyruvate kinase [Granulosicoccus antarcticus IMCC3135]